AMRPLSAREVAALAEAVPGRDRALIFVLGYAGLRIGEAAALRVGDVDLLRRRLHVRASASEVRGRWILGSTKTDRERSVALPAFLAEELARHLEAHSSPSAPEAFVFTGPGGSPLRPNNWRRRVFLPAQRAAGITPLRRIHDLRHTAAALAIEAGAHPKMVQEMLGHSSITVTLDVYGHLFPSLHDALAASLEETFRRAAAERGTVVPMDRHA
ncbi:MAG TPA: site-specific integrase, partial [Actinomycetota bacterium]|nr:site-specific integrase [Actinomycetota bacterium]